MLGLNTFQSCKKEVFSIFKKKFHVFLRKRPYSKKKIVIKAQMPFWTRTDKKKMGWCTLVVKIVNQQFRLSITFHYHCLFGDCFSCLEQKKNLNNSLNGWTSIKINIYVSTLHLNTVYRCAEEKGVKLSD